MIMKWKKNVWDCLFLGSNFGWPNVWGLIVFGTKWEAAQVDRVVNSLRVPTTNAQCNTSWQNPIHLLWTHGNNKIDFFNELILSVEPTRVSFSITYKANKTELKVTFILKMKCDLVISEIEVFSLSN